MVKRLRHELADYQSRKQSVGSELESTSDISYNSITEDTRELEKYVVKAIRSHAQVSEVRKRSSPPGPPPPGPIERKARETSPLPKSEIVVNGTEDREGVNRRPTSGQIPDITIGNSSPQLRASRNTDYDRTNTVASTTNIARTEETTSRKTI